MGITTVEELYSVMQKLQICRNERDFSVNWLGMSEGYYRLKGEETSVNALFTCWDRLAANNQFSLAQGCLALMRERNRINLRSEGNRGPRAERTRRRATAECAA